LNLERNLRDDTFEVRQLCSTASGGFLKIAKKNKGQKYAVKMMQKCSNFAAVKIVIGLAIERC
jgi:hypothetical protein